MARTRVHVRSGWRMSWAIGTTAHAAAPTLRRRCRTGSLLFALMLSKAVTAGTVFAWVDEDGVLSLSDEAPPAEIVDFKSVELRDLPPQPSDPSSEYYSIINQLNRMQARRRAAERERLDRRRAQSAQDEYAPEAPQSFVGAVGGYSNFRYGRYPSHYRPLKHGRSYYYRDYRYRPKTNFRRDYQGAKYFSDRYRSDARKKAREGVPIKAPRRSTRRVR